MSGADPYCGETIALATMHAKERAVAKPFNKWLGVNIVVAPEIDTDAFGTFTGEIARQGTMIDVARAKALAAIDATGFSFGLGSEGSFGPHPALPLIAADTEVLLFIDRVRDLEIHETFVTPRTNFSSCNAAAGDDIGAFLDKAQFPSHAVVVKPHTSQSLEIVKGIKNIDQFNSAIERAARFSDDGRALIVTDMRAHMNPTRMAVIRALSSRLAKRLATPCPVCRKPGFGRVDFVRGRPCAVCGEPTDLVFAEIHRCATCSHEFQIPKSRQPKADPAHCQFCNP